MHEPARSRRPISDNGRGRSDVGTKRRSNWRRNRRDYLFFLGLVSPNFAIIIVFAHWPVIYNAYLSLTSWDMIKPSPTWIGVGNYVDLFTSSEFAHILLNTLQFTGVVVLGSLVAGLPIALLFNQRLHGQGVARTIAFAPHVVSGAAVATLWLFIFDPNYGLSRVFLGAVGADSPNWVNNSQYSLWALIIVYLWRGIGYAAVIYVAGLQGLPDDLYDAAKIDGASAWAQLRNITVPLLSPITFFLALTEIILTFQAFDVTAIMTEGGPGVSSTTISWYIYEEAFQASDVGRAAAVGVVMFFMLLIGTGFQLRYMERKVHYQ